MAWPLTRQNCLRASTMQAAHQRSAICPSLQGLTLRAWSRLIEIIDSIAFVDRSVRLPRSLPNAATSR